MCVGYSKSVGSHFLYQLYHDRTRKPPAIKGGGVFLYTLLNVISEKMTAVTLAITAFQKKLPHEYVSFTSRICLFYLTNKSLFVGE